MPQTWGAIIARTLTDPVWFFVTDWFPIYLVAKGFELRSSVVAVWVPFVAADLGNFSGGIASGWLIKHGWSLGAARKAVVIFGGLGVTLLIPTIFSNSLFVITSLFALATFSYAAFSTIANVLPADLYDSESVATVSGLGGTGSGIGTIIAFLLVGHYSDLRQGMTTHVFDPIVDCRRADSFLGDDSGLAAGQEHESHQARAGASALGAQCRDGFRVQQCRRVFVEIKHRVWMGSQNGRRRHRADFASENISQ